MSDDLTRWRQIADLDSRAGEPVGKALREAADQVERLREELDALKAAEKRMRTLAHQLKASENEIDRADGHLILHALDHPTDTPDDTHIVPVEDGYDHRLEETCGCASEVRVLGTGQRFFSHKPMVSSSQWASGRWQIVELTDHPTDTTTTTGDAMKIDDLTGAIDDALDYVLDNSHTTPNVDLTRFRETRGLIASGALILLFAHQEATPTDTTVCPHGKPTSADQSAITTTGVTFCTCCGDGFNGRVSGSDRCKTCRPDTTGETETR